MDPVGQMFATEAIAKHGMSVVGWYHSHPDFQPIPSVTDVDNQASYQQLFQGSTESKSRNNEPVSPFVGLIVGTYDGKNPTSHSVMRWFHVRPKETEEGNFVNFPMNLRTTNRHYRRMRFDNKHEENSIRKTMTVRGTDIRRIQGSRYLSCPVSKEEFSEAKIVLNDDHSHHASKEKLCGGDAKSVGVEIDATTSDQIVRKTNHLGDGQLVGIKLDAAKSDQDHVTGSPANKESKETCQLTITDSDKSPLLLSEAVFDPPGECNYSKWRFQSARPLYFAENERLILQMDQDNIPDDVFGGIVWYAVER